MKNSVNEQRSVILGEYIIQNKSTVRATAKHFGISKSTVHKDVSEKLPEIDKDLASKVKDILEINKKERHIRGGMATKMKYQRIAEESGKKKSYYQNDCPIY